MAIPPIPEIRDLMEAGMHFGHSSGKWHPKMKPYIFATRDKLHIIDLEKTRDKLREVLTILEKRVSEGKVVVLVGTKKQVSDRVKEIGEANHIPYVDVRWLGGTMTNFTEVQKSISRMKKLEVFLAGDEAKDMIKKERVRLEAELERMHHKFGGLRDLTKKPDALFIIDPSHEHNAVKEGLHEKLELFGVIDTNCKPDLMDHFIPANDDAPKSLALLLDMIEKTVQSGQKLGAQGPEEAAKPAEAAPEVTAASVEEAVAEELEVIEEKVKEEVAEEEKQADKGEDPEEKAAEPAEKEDAKEKKAKK